MKTVSIFVPILLAVFIFGMHICFSFSVVYHHNIFVSTYEFIVVAKSGGRMVVYFMFNVIIVIVFFGSFKPSSAFEGDFFCDSFYLSFPTSTAYEVDINVGAKEEAVNNDGDGYEYSSEEEADEDQFHGSDGYDKDDENEDDDDVYYVFITDDEYGGEEKEGHDDHLKRRIEEFIDKVNCKWREELRYEKLTMMCS